MDLPAKLLDTIATHPWMVGVLVLSVALSYFFTKAGPALTNLFQAIMDTQSQTEIKDTVKEIREQQVDRYSKIDERDKKTDKRLTSLETNQTTMQEDITLLKDAARCADCPEPEA